MLSDKRKTDIINKSVIVLLILPLLFIFGCNGDGPLVPMGKPEIVEASPDTVVIGGIVTLMGNNFGEKADGGKIVYAGNLSIKAADCGKWNFSMIKFSMPLTAESGTFAVFVNGDTSNAVFVYVEKIPPLELEEVPSGVFIMGSDNGLQEEQPVHLVQITKPMEVSKYEITQGLWQAIMGYDSSISKGADLPVDNISWMQAILFCNQLSKRFGYDSCYTFSGEDVIYNTAFNGFRLPTEAEWEYVCRAGTKSDFAGTGILEGMGWYAANSGFKTHKSGEKRPNDFGIYDMHGNIWEWCWDWYSSTYYRWGPGVNPVGPEWGQRRVMRGGSAIDGASFVRSANRSVPDDTRGFCGLRVFRTKK